MILYFVTCRSTGKSYVGITSTSMSSRWIRHVSGRHKMRNKFHAAIAQYGADDFDVSVLWRYDFPDQAMDAERDIIAGLNLTESGYNMTAGGDGVRMKRVVSEATRAKLSAAGKRRTFYPSPSPANRAAVSAAMKARVISDVTRDKLSIAATLDWARRKSFGQYTSTFEENYYG